MRVENVRLKLAALVGFALVCVLLFAYLFQLAGGRFRLSEPYNAKVLVPDAFNIVLNSDVRRQGVLVGRVRGVEPQGGMGEIKFELEEEGQQQLFRDATVRVRTKTLVGESYLDLDPGTPAKGKLPSGSTLPLEAAEEAVPLERIFDSFDPQTRKQIRRNMEGLGEGLKGRGDELNELFAAMQPTVASGGRLVRTLEPQRQALARLIDNTGEVFQAFGEREAAGRRLVQDAKTAAEAAASRDAQLRASIEELPDTLGQAQSSLGKLGGFAGRANPVMADLRVAARELGPTVRDLGPAAKDARRLFAELTPFLEAADPLFDELRPASRALDTVIRPLETVLRQANPALRYLSRYERELGAFLGNIRGMNAYKDATGNKGRVFGMFGYNALIGLPPELKRLADAFLDSGTFGLTKSLKYRSYDAPGSLGDMKPFTPDQYTPVDQPDK